jgi:hypothetical protein
VATNQNPEKGNRILSCEAWEAMLTDALDGTLSAADTAAFTAHSDGCVACGELLEDTKRGSEWLQFLRETPPTPNGLVERILAGTSGLPEAGPLLPAGAATAIPHQPWLGLPMHMLQRGVLSRHMAESRILMTLAMAFFSIALTLNLTGVHLNQLKLSDLKPTTLASTISHQYFATSKNVQRYYSNLRFVYEVESRLNEIRQTDGRPAERPSTQPEPAQQPVKQQSGQPRPGQQQPQSQPASRPAGKSGGSARKDEAPPQSKPGRMRGEVPLSVLAHFLLYPRTSLIQNTHICPTLRACSTQLLYPGNTHPQSERSLV